MKTLEHPDKFVNRHIGPNDDELKEMAEFCGADSVEDLIDQTVPKHIRMEKDLDLDNAITEYQLIEKLRKIAAKNKVYKSYIGMGYHPTILPPVIQRNILENPGWYTQYTPYQAEIAQGRLEALLNFQTTVIDLTGMEIANASLLDEATAAAEAMIMFYNLRKGDKKNSNTFFVSEECYPQTLDVIKTRAESLGIDLRIDNYKKLEFTDEIFGVLVQYPAGYGEIRDYKKFFEEAEKNNVKKIVTSDLLSLTLLTPPGEFGADVVVGSSQRFGVPMGYGGPHAAFFATKDEYKRNIPGRIIGVSVDAEGNNAYRMALQTREQHIRREKATSNICTAQVLLAIIAGMYAVYHGPEGLKKIGERILNLTHILAKALIELGYKQLNEDYFDTLQLDITGMNIKIDDVKNETIKNEINIRFIDDKRFGVSINEVTTLEDIKELVEIFSKLSGKSISDEKLNDVINNTEFKIYPDFIRQSKYLEHPVFNTYQSETELLRYMKGLENKDLSLVHSMIPLGSCTMKLNATSEMAAITWSEFADLHPFIPIDQAEGYKQIISELENDLAEITGFDGVSLQPNSGAQGEYTGLMVIRAYHQERGDHNRNIILIPSSAHGTNPASAVMAGMKVVVVNCDKHGNIDTDDLKKRAEEYSKNLSALMITYPSTHGVFEANVKEICEIIHQNGGQVYMDGANMNAQVGYTSPSIIGADVCHLNLHKTFCIPHGGGGPGMGPIAVASHLTKFLPAHPIIDIKKEKSISAVSAAPWGSADILLISYSYIKLMGVNGLKKATLAAIINANYLKCKLSPHYKVLYSGKTGRIAHELIFDMREFKTSAQIEVEDIAKRLMDYGYHAPTVSFPVPGTLMVEPTESESKDELDRFIEAMVLIRKEIEEIENGTIAAVDNPLKNAPHTATMVISDDWQHGYSRERAAFPAEWTRKNKFWPAVARVDSAYGDRNLVCSCIPLEDYAEQEV